jgi:transposase-like protein
MEANPKTLLEAIQTYADADAALGEAVDSRWPKGVICPHCDSDKAVFIKTRRIWMCSRCRKQFSVKAGTLLEDSPIGLDKWLPAIWMIAGDKNGISSSELHRALGVTQKTAWFMLHRIRLAMQGPETGGKIGGEGKHIEADESFIGGRARNMHKDTRERKITGRGPEGKAIVAAVLERGGKVRAKVVEHPQEERPSRDGAGVC